MEYPVIIRRTKPIIEPDTIIFLVDMIILLEFFDRVDLDVDLVVDIHCVSTE